MFELQRLKREKILVTSFVRPQQLRSQFILHISVSCAFLLAVDLEISNTKVEFHLACSHDSPFPMSAEK